MNAQFLSNLSDTFKLLKLNEGEALLIILSSEYCLALLSSAVGIL